MPWASIQARKCGPIREGHRSIRERVIRQPPDNSSARPSGTEAIYKVYAESFKGEDHLRDILREAQIIVDAALATGNERLRDPSAA